jgi:hypothetical protein
MKVYITKYALSKAGIELRDVEERGDGMVADRSRSFNIYFHGEGREWSRDYESALARAENMRIAKIASLKKQIARLEKLQFSDPAKR